MRLVGVGLVTAIAATLAAGPARARETSDLERDCRSVVSGDPSAKALEAALARVGSHGKTRLDLAVRTKRIPRTKTAPPSRRRVARAPGWGNVRVLSLSGQVDDDDRPTDPFFKELRKHLPPDACLR